ncbi:hypothetical protein C8Q80DRAFT_1259211 [Daedaleopsis nitida]|nr:hypothetical protein C8Q80DRAFT_1259211 [Daedaleopsis nitida]
MLPGPTSNSPDPDSSSPNPGPGKVKQTRRRQRLSCVECTRRRQKCDRQVPCSLCVTRGIPHLCRWEPLVARPAPQRPPDAGVPAGPSQSTIATLSARIAALEEALLRQNIPVPTGGTGARLETPRLEPTDRSANDSSPAYITTSLDDLPPEPESSPDCGRPRERSPSERSDSAELSHYDFEVQLAAVKMAQLSLAPSNEYVGGGTVICALHRMGDPDTYRFPYARSSTTTFSNPYSSGDNVLSALIKPLLASLPSRETVEVLVNGTFAERSWQFGIPELWFRTSLQVMWTVLESRCPGPSCAETGGCVRCTQEVNPHWLSLLFAVLALAPRRLVGTDARLYFWKALEARRIVEDFMLRSPAYSAAPTQCVVHGMAMSCMAAALLAAYLADRGRVSDAWKLTGTALRNAQAVGLHRDPGWMMWEKMDRQETELRLLGWWFLVSSDRIYSLVLGRPTMANRGTFDVKLIPGTMHGDGAENPFVHYQQMFILLMCLVEETVTRCLGITAPSYATVLEMDRKFKQWQAKLHPSMDWRIAHPLSSSATPRERSIAYQRHVCAAYYLGTLMNIHRLYLMKPPPILPPPKGMAVSVVMNPSREQCIELAMELVAVLCDAHEQAAKWDTDPPVPLVVFQYAYFVFDGAVALVGALTQDPPHPKASKCLALIDRATEMLEACRRAKGEGRDGEGDTASRALTVLSALRKGGRWDERFRARAGGQDSAPATTTATATRAAAAAAAPVQSQVPATGAESSFLPSSTIRMPVGGTSLSSYMGADIVGMSSSFPFLNAARAQGTPSFPAMPGPIHAQTSSTTLPGQPFDLGTDICMTAPEMGYGTGSMGGGRSSMQTMVMPFDMLQNSESYDVDWAAVMGSTGWMADQGLGGGQS